MGGGGWSLAYHPEMRIAAQVFADPPLVEQWLLINPWPLVVALGAMGVALGMRARSSGRPRLNLAAGMMLLLAVGVWGLATTVTTQREEVAAAMRGLLRATVEADATAIHSAVDPGATVLGPDGRSMVGAGSLAAELAEALRRHPISHHRVQDLVVRPVTADRAQVRLDLRTTFRKTGYPNATLWLITWRRAETGSPWQVVEIQWLQWQGQRPPGAVWR